MKPLVNMVSTRIYCLGLASWVPPGCLFGGVLVHMLGVLVAVISAEAFNSVSWDRGQGMLSARAILGGALKDFVDLKSCFPSNMWIKLQGSELSPPSQNI